MHSTCCVRGRPIVHAWYSMDYLSIKSLYLGEYHHMAPEDPSNMVYLVGKRHYAICPIYLPYLGIPYYVSVTK